MAHPAQVRIQGTLKGTNSTPQGNVPRSFSTAQLAVNPPKDQATGQTSGKRQHEPLTIVTQVDASASLLTHAYLTKNPLGTVVVELVGPPSSGTGHAGSKLTLHDVLVSQLVKYVGKHPGHGKTTELVEVTLTFQKIEHSGAKGGLSGCDDWTNKN
jgi:type VI secretion system Hcp family effector